MFMISIIKNLFTTKNMKDEKISETDISKFYSDIMAILLPLPDIRIAEIYCELNSYTIPKEFAGISPFVGKENTMEISLDYWIAFSDAVERIIPKENITKAHYRNLLANKFQFGDNYVFMKKK